MIVVPLDFLVLLNFKPKGPDDEGSEPVLNQIVTSLVLTLKQVLYSRATSDGKTPEKQMIVFTMSSNKKKEGLQSEVLELLQKAIKTYI